MFSLGREPQEPRMPNSSSPGGATDDSPQDLPRSSAVRGYATHHVWRCDERRRRDICLAWGVSPRNRGMPNSSSPGGATDDSPQDLPRSSAVRGYATHHVWRCDERRRRDICLAWGVSPRLSGYPISSSPRGATDFFARGVNPGPRDYDPGMSATGAGMMFQVNPESPSGWV